MRVSRTIIETADLDAYPGYERELGWDSQKAQLNPGAGFHRFALVTLGDLNVWRYHSSSKLYHDFTTLTETVDLVFFRESKGIVWTGQQLPELSMLVHRADQSYWATTPPDLPIYGLYLSRKKARHWDLLPFDFLTAQPSARNSILVSSSHQVGPFLDRIDALVDSRPGSFSSNDEAITIHEQLLSDLYSVLETGLLSMDEFRIRALPRRKLLDDARDLIEEHIEETLTASDLADRLFVSRRVLELAFKDAFGIGPYQFIVNQKLHAIRRALLRREGSVRQTADRFGFVNAGRLAGMYVRLFGELPSQTLGTRGSSG